MCTGLAAPSRIGPTVMPLPAAFLSRLKAMLAASRVGKISRLASSRIFALGKICRRWRASSAESPCISPSTCSSGWRSCSMRSAVRIFAAVGESAEPKDECDSSAMRGSMPKRFISSAASSVISTTCSGVGS